jgi:hypothetical protein
MNQLLLASIPALIAGALSLWGSQWQLNSKIGKVRQQLEAEYLGRRRLRAAQVKDALLFHAELLRTQLVAVQGKLSAGGAEAETMRGWFRRVKDECARGGAKDAAAFSASLHYDLTFAMTTLYYTALYLRYAQEMRRLIPFSGGTTGEQEAARERLSRIASAFARTGTSDQEERRGLWLPVQDDMGMIVRKGAEHISYFAFCRLFVETTNERQDHVFLRPLDFFGASPAVGLDPEGTSRIVEALQALLAAGQARPAA